ncbi:hypothetical protein TeGR_g7119 [Tetraparma gracilis]|uniref:Uncharacterized protein n=1 Tax=Tetraparma gracilis TaxID=2962635 RepID=A0ABQ6N5N9_9STRA|nr:hypothetical protein TeGR_g7119 [Tetraparma gracilis]
MGNSCCPPPSSQSERLPIAPPTPKFTPANAPWRGPLGLGLLPAMRGFLRDHLMHEFLARMYADEIRLLEADGGVTAWSAVAHNPAPGDASLAGMSPSMNVAMPDQSAEYWTTYVPADRAPVFELRFPDWAVYSAFTIYDSHGLPVASLNSREAAHYTSTGKKAFRSGSGFIKDGRCYINLLRDNADPGPLCALFRVYRPAHKTLTAADELPAVHLIPRADAGSFNASSPLPPALPLASTAASFASGKRVEASFQKLINKHMKPLKGTQRGTQFFHPSSVAGLFVNANATYVIAFLRDGQKGMRMKSSVPSLEPHRPYYGVMTVDYHSTKTTSSATWEELGGWGEEFTVFAARSEKEAAKHGGYKAGDPRHKLLLWGDDIKGPHGLCLRYLHLFEPCGREGEAEDIRKADDERGLLLERNGDAYGNFVRQVPGLGEIEYF